MAKPDNFIDIPFNQENLDLYIVRTSILKALKWALPHLHGELLDIGCGKMPYRDYILNHSGVTSYTGLDIESALEYDQNIRPDFEWDGITMPFDYESFDCAIGTEVLEHCPEPEVVLRETHKVLKPGGVFFFTVPFLWNLHEVPHDEYRYTPFALERHLQNSGFRDIEIYATGGWHLAMAQMLGLWLKRSPISRISGFRKNVLTRIIKYTMSRLIHLSAYEKINFNSAQMITGLYGKAIKKYE